MARPFQFITKRLVSVTSATIVASKFSLFANSINAFTSSLATKTAIRSCDSDTASSVPFNPLYLTGTAFKSIFNPSANSPMATQTPPAPKSLHFLIKRVTSPLRNKRWILRSVGAFPF